MLLTQSECLSLRYRSGADCWTNITALKRHFVYCSCTAWHLHTCQTTYIVSMMFYHSRACSLLKLTSWCVPRARLVTAGDQAFHIAGSRVWNSLPADVASAPSLPIFQRRLKTFLFHHSCPGCCCWHWLLSGLAVGVPRVAYSCHRCLCVAYRCIVRCYHTSVWEVKHRSVRRIHIYRL